MLEDPKPGSSADSEPLNTHAKEEPGAIEMPRLLDSAMGLQISAKRPGPGMHLTNRWKTFDSTWTQSVRLTLFWRQRRWGRLLWRILGYGSGGGRASGILRAWVIWERLSDFLWHAERIPGAPYGLLKIRTRHYRGDQMRFPDDTVVSSGDLILELHCNNSALIDLGTRGDINRLRACRRELESLARWLSEVDSTLHIKALYGVTMLWWAAVRLGFSVRERRQPVHNWFDRLFMGGLLLIYSPNGSDRANHGTTLDLFPREVWLSRPELIRHYARLVKSPNDR